MIAIPWRAGEALQLHLLNLQGVSRAWARPLPQLVTVSRPVYPEVIWTEFLGTPLRLDAGVEVEFTVHYGGVLTLNR